MKLLIILLIASGAFLIRPTAEATKFLKLDPPSPVPVVKTVTSTSPEIKPVTQAQEQPQAIVAQTKTVEPQPTPVVTPPPATGTCEAEIAKYDWHQGTAIAVARAESGLRIDALNNNPATGDYSVGCFQINIYGANARTRPSETQLKDPQVNVLWAYKIYVANKGSFIGQWGVCRKISCY